MQTRVDSTDSHRRTWLSRWPLGAVAGSLALPLVVAVVAVKLSGNPQTALHRPITIQLKLLPPELTPKPEPEAFEHEPGPEPVQDLAQTEAQISTTETQAPSLDTEPAPELPLGDRAQHDSGQQLADRILQSIKQQTVAREHLPQRQFPWGPSGAPIRGLPGTRGWLSAHVGRVRPEGDSWKENDGSSRARYVLADGTVICTHRRAPTIDEMMNPWKSIAVTMARICGRERPAEVDYSDPRVQPQPRLARDD